MYLDAFLWFLLGFLVKFADAQVDELVFRRFSRSEFGVALAYGLIGGCLLSSGIVSATIALALLLGVLLSGKADHPAHRLGVAAMLAIAGVRGLPQIAILPFIALLLSGYADERMSDRADGGKISNRLLREFFSRRMATDAMAVLLAIGLGQPTFAFFVIAFDFGYQGASLLASKAAPKLMRGHHLIMDCFGCSRKALESESGVKKFLEGAVEEIGMTKIAGPFTVRFEPKRKGESREWGISGVVIIAESHISCHTYPYKGTAKIDVYSCKEFDRGAAEKYCKAYFRADRFESKFLQRPLDEHLSVSDREGARKILEAGRK